MKNNAFDASNSKPTQYATFCCGTSCFGLDIAYVREINRHEQLTRVPLSPPFVRGVMNLRGEMVTMLDLRRLLGLPAAAPTLQHRNLILTCDSESFGLWVDSVSDILTLRTDDISPTPSNLSLALSRLIRGVVQSESALILIIEPREILAASLSQAR